MVLKGKLEAEVELRSSGDLFHEILGTNLHTLPATVSNHIQSCEHHDGELGKPGALLNWNFILDGEPCDGKSLTESIDEKNRSAKYTVTGGSMMEGKYKSLTVSIHVTPGEFCDLVKWVVEFERLHEDAPFPANLLGLYLQVTKDIEKQHRSSSRFA